jgi:hypothetical protein
MFDHLFAIFTRNFSIMKSLVAEVEDNAPWQGLSPLSIWIQGTTVFKMDAVFVVGATHVSPVHHHPIFSNNPKSVVS